MTTPADTRLRRALLASLLLNLVLAGATGALWWRAHAARDATAQGIDRPLLREHLRDPGRETFRRVMRERREALRAHLPALRAARGAVADQLGARPFDPAALDAALAALRAQEQRAAEDAHATLARLAAELDDDERTRLAQGMREGRRGRRH